jgi:hypothetical protein
MISNGVGLVLLPAAIFLLNNSREGRTATLPAAINPRNIYSKEHYFQGTFFSRNMFFKEHFFPKNMFGRFRQGTFFSKNIFSKEHIISEEHFRTFSILCSARADPEKRGWSRTATPACGN